MLANRVTAYSGWRDPRDYSWALIALADFSRALHALRRGGLNALGRSASPRWTHPARRHLARLPSTAHRPARPGQASVSEDTRRILWEVGIDARVDSLLLNGKPVPAILPRPINPDQPHVLRVAIRRMYPDHLERDLVRALLSKREAS